MVTCWPGTTEDGDTFRSRAFTVTSTDPKDSPSSSMRTTLLTPIRAAVGTIILSCPVEAEPVVLLSATMSTGSPPKVTASTIPPVQSVTLMVTVPAQNDLGGAGRNIAAYREGGGVAIGGLIALAVNGVDGVVASVEFVTDGQRYLEAALVDSNIPAQRGVAVVALPGLRWQCQCRSPYRRR